MKLQSGFQDHQLYIHLTTPFRAVSRRDGHSERLCK